MKHKISENDQKIIAHFIAQRYANTAAPGCYNEATENYLEAYNNVLYKLENYNSSIKE